MTRKLISSGSPFEATVGYSRAVVQGDWCFVAGTTGYDYTTMTMPEDVKDQAANALATIDKALAEGGFAVSDIVRATYYISDASYWSAIGPVLGGVFADIRPARPAL
jgi:enamine deaminase RidA (YjgF/YER057c/UK114 family)